MPVAGVVVLGREGAMRARYGKVAALLRAGRLVPVAGAPAGFYRWADYPEPEAAAALARAVAAAEREAAVERRSARQARRVGASDGLRDRIGPARRPRRVAHGWGRAPVGCYAGR